MRCKLNVDLMPSLESIESSPLGTGFTTGSKQDRRNTLCLPMEEVSHPLAGVLNSGDVQPRPHESESPETLGTMWIT